MKIGLDSRTLSKRGGSKVYALNLIEKLNGSEELDIILYGPQESFSTTSKNPQPRNENLRVVWENFSLTRQVRKDNIDIFHGLKNAIPLFDISAPKILTFHGSSYLELRNPSIKRRLYWNLRKKYVQEAEKVITVSNYSKQRLIEQGYKSEKIHTIHHGIDRNEFYRFKPQKAKEKFKSTFPKLKAKIEEENNIALAVGNNQGLKNHKTAIKACKQVRDLELIIVGKNKEKTGQEVKNTHFLGSTAHELMPLLYNIADIFIFPSKYESFGIPNLEAMACGTPIITSNRAAIPEIVGDVAITIDPNNVEKLAEEIERVIKSDTIRREMRKKDLKRAEKFSWEKTAKETVEVYREVLK